MKTCSCWGTVQRFEHRRYEATDVISFHVHISEMPHSRAITAKLDKKAERRNTNCCSRIHLPKRKKKKKKRLCARWLKIIKSGTRLISRLLRDARLRLKRQPGAGPIQCRWYGDQMACQPASRGGPVAASATPSRLLKGDTIPINVFLSTLLRCLFNTAPGGFGARTAWVKLHFSGLQGRCDKSPVQVRDSQGPSGSDGSRGGR